MSDANELVEVEVWVMVGEDGQYTAHTDPDALRERFDEECADAGLTTRVLKLTVKVPTPRPVALAAVVADEVTTGELKAV